MVMKKEDLDGEPTVKDIMTTNVFTLYEDDNLRVLSELMNWRNIRHIPVVDQENHLVGLMTHRDFLKIALSNLSGISESEANHVYEDIPIGEVMIRNVASVGQETPLFEAADLMASEKYGCLPVVEQGRLTGIVTEADFVRAFRDWKVTFEMPLV